MGLVVAAVAVLTLAVVADRAGASEQCVRFTAAADQRRALVTGTGKDVVVIGDSYAVGLGVLPAESWPTRLAGQVRVDGFSGSGFSVGASGCPGVDFANRAASAVRAATDLVVVQGGLNDFDQPEADVEAGFDRLVEALDDVPGDRPVVVVGPPDAPERSGTVPDVDALLERLAADHGLTYVSMRGLSLPYLPDDLHLTPRGHRMFGQAVAKAVRGIAR